jgi:hypothetical protein
MRWLRDVDMVGGIHISIRSVKSLLTVTTRVTVVGMGADRIATALTTGIDVMVTTATSTMTVGDVAIATLMIGDVASATSTTITGGVIAGSHS